MKLFFTILIAVLMLPIIVISGAACGACYLLGIWFEEVWRQIIEKG